jgi:hypothetical protein
MILVATQYMLTRHTYTHTQVQQRTYKAITLLSRASVFKYLRVQTHIHDHKPINIHTVQPHAHIAKNPQFSASHFHKTWMDVTDTCVPTDSVTERCVSTGDVTERCVSTGDVTERCVSTGDVTERCVSTDNVTERGVSTDNVTERCVPTENVAASDKPVDVINDKSLVLRCLVTLRNFWYVTVGNLEK